MDESDSTNELMASVGEAINAWSSIEWALDGLFGSISGTDSTRSSIIMASIISLEARLQVIDNLIGKISIRDELRTYWSRCFNRIKKQARKRNELAHFTVVSRFFEGKGKSPVLLPYFSVGRLSIAPAKNGTPVIRELGHKDIQHRASVFYGLAAAVRWLSVEMRVEQGKRAVNHLPITDLVQLLLQPIDQTPTES